MTPVAIGFASTGLLILTMGFFIRRGATWLIAGYDPDQVRDEKGLARWFGLRFMIMGMIGILAGISIYVLPPDYFFGPVIAYVVGILGGVIVLLSGVHRFVK